MVQFILFPLIHCRWAGAAQRQITFQNIEELRKFIQAVIPDKISNALFDSSIGTLFTADDPGIILKLEHQAALDTVLCHQLCLSGFRIQIHTAEFIHPEQLAVLTNTGLLKENRARRFDVNDGSNDYGQQQCESTAHKTTHNIQHPFPEQFLRGCQRHAEGPHRGSGELLHRLALPFLHIHLLHLNMNHDAHFCNGVDQFRRIGRTDRQREENLIHPLVAQIVYQVFLRCRNGNTGHRFPSFILIQQAHTLNLVGSHIVPVKIFNHFFCTAGHGHNVYCRRKRIFPSLPQNLLPHQTNQVTDQGIVPSRQEKGDSGILFRTLYRKQESGNHHRNQKTMLCRLKKFPIRSTLQNILHGAVHDQNYEIHRGIDKCHVAVQLIRIGTLQAMAGYVGQYKCHMEAENIQKYEICVFNPTLGFGRIHLGICLLLSL